MRRDFLNLTKMKIKSFRHEGVRPDGTFENQGGAVNTEGKIAMSEVNGGCGSNGCHCSDGHWIMIAKPRTEDGIVEGICVTFDNSAEMQELFDNRELKIS